VSIGEELSEARRRAGLTEAEISQRTRIRETIIRGIERDDYAECGGDFYARGFIRAIARAVDTDPAPLIRDYDAAHRAPPEAEGTDSHKQVTPVWLISAWLRGRRRLNVTALLGLALAIAVGLACYQLVSASGLAPGGSREKAANLASGRHHAVLPVTPRPSSAPPAREVVVQLTAIEDCWVEFTTSSGGYLFQYYVSAGTSRRWTFRHAVDMQMGNPGGVTLRVNGTNPLPPGISHPIKLRLGLNGTAG
jgi:cytoskeletal protein RodZ